jgi:hypothetical protein
MQIAIKETMEGDQVEMQMIVKKGMKGGMQSAK